MRDKIFKTINIVCLILLVISNVPSQVIDQWLGYFGLERNQAQAGIIEPLDETDWQPFTDNAIRKRNEDGSWTANFYQNNRYVYYQDRWQLKRDLLEVAVGENEEIIFSYGDREFRLVPYVHFHEKKYLYETLNPLVKEQINLEGEIKDEGKKWQHTLAKAKYLEKISFQFAPTELVQKESNTTLILDDFTRLNFIDLVESGYQIELTENELVVEGLKEGINILDPTDTFYSTDAADGYIYRSEPDQTTFLASSSGTLDNVGFDYENTPIDEDGGYSRAYFSFDTSDLPDGSLSSISSATIYTYADSYSKTSKFNPPGGAFVYDYYCDTDDIGASLDTGDWGLSSPSLCVDDYDWAETTGWKSQAITSYVTKTGDTDVEIRFYSNATPAKHAIASIRDTAYSGTTYDPYLSVTYTEYDPEQKNWRWYEDVSDVRDYMAYQVDDSDAQAYEGTDSDGTFNDDDAEFSSVDYQSIDSDDSSGVTDLDGPPVSSEFNYHRFDFTIDEDTADILQVDVIWKGYTFGDAGNGQSLWIEEDDTWTERDSGTASSSETLTYSYTSDFDDIIDGSGNMYVGAQSDITNSAYSAIVSYYAEVRVYTQTLDEDLGAENTKAYPNTVFWGRHLKLRVTIENDGTVALNNVRKYLQFSTDESSWTTVSENDAGSPAAWRYGDSTKCGGTDDAEIPTVLLSDATAVATHNEEGDSASTYDHAASTAAEWEFCLENYKADPGTTYYFQVKDDTYGAISLGSGETHPQLRTSEIPVRSGINGTFSEVAYFDIYGATRHLAMKFQAPADLADWKISFYGREQGTVLSNLYARLFPATATDDSPGTTGFIDEASMDLSGSDSWQADLAFTADIKEGCYYWLVFFISSGGDSSNYYRLYYTQNRLSANKVQTTTNLWSSTDEGGTTAIRIKNSGGTDLRIYDFMNAAVTQDLPTANTYQIYEPPGDLTITHVYYRFAARKGDGSAISFALCNHDTGCSSDIATKTFYLNDAKGMEGWIPIKLDEPVDLTGGTAYRFKIDNTTSGDWQVEYGLHYPGSESLGGTSDYLVWNGSSYTDRDMAFRLANHGLNEDYELDNIEVMGGSSANINTATEKYAFAFEPSVNGTISSVTINLYKSGSPIDNFDISIQTDSGSGTPSGFNIATDTIAGSSVSSSYNWETFNSFSPVGVVAGATYWVVMERDGSTDNSNYYRIFMLKHYKDMFHVEYYNGSTWGQDGSNSTLGAEVVTSTETIQQEWQAGFTSYADASTDWLAQSMTPEVQKTVNGFLAPIGRQYTEESEATATVSLYSDSSGDPGSELSGTLTKMRPRYQDYQSPHGGVVPLEFPTSYVMSADTTYWMMVKGLDADSDNIVGWQRKDWNTNSESFGGTSDVAKYSTNGGTSWSSQNDDWVFWTIEEPYGPESKNWRFYGDESSTTPTSPYAAENTAPNGTIGDGDIFKLRVTVDEAGSDSGIANSKKKIQYDTTSDFSGTPTDVGESGSATIWRYSTSCGGSDNGTLDGRVLSDSDTSGTYNESGSSTTTLDHDVDELMEFEFCLENNSATADTQYYFRVYDTATEEVISKADGESYPNLTTATYELSVTSEDNEIGFDNYALGTTGSSSHAFTSDEEIIAADWTGNGSGWSVSASATDLIGDTYTIDNSAIDWDTDTIYALYGASLTGVTSSCTAGSPCNLNSSQTIFSASAGNGQGSYYIQPTVTITIGDDEFVDDYESTVTITIS